MSGNGRVLFVCIENAGRSQMAEAFGRKYGLDCSSAGTFPSEKVNPDVVEAMKEKGIDMSGRKPATMTDEMVNRADLVVIMGCSVEEACPAPMVSEMRKKMVDWGIDDPKGKTMEEIRVIRDTIEQKVAALAGVEAPGSTTG